MLNCHFEELGHTAEIGLRIQADAPEDLFACAAQAMFALLRTPVDLDQPPVVHPIRLDALDNESLMVDWLSELLYLHEITGALFTECTVLRWTPTRLEAEARGRKPLAAPAIHIKAVTYHQLAITVDAGGWMDGRRTSISIFDPSAFDLSAAAGDRPQR
jgi:SHS2 domain-containing protein